MASCATTALLSGPIQAPQTASPVCRISPHTLHGPTAPATNTSLPTCIHRTRGCHVAAESSQVPRFSRPSRPVGVQYPHIPCIPGRTGECRVEGSGSPQLRPPQAVAGSAVAGTLSLPGGWEEFSVEVSGEWEGYASDFRPDGSPVELPQGAVPQAFRDWGLALFAWQSHSSTLAGPDGRISTRTVRFYPAVACDSLDPPAFSQQDETFGLQQIDTGVVAFRSDGSFAAARPGRSVSRAGRAGELKKVVVREDVGSELVFELEHCLVAKDPAEGGRARVRVLQQFERESVTSVPRLTGLSLFRERWTGEYAGNTSDAGSTSFAEGPPVGLDAVEGRWLATKTVAKFPQGTSLGPRGSVLEMEAGGREEVTRQLTEEGAVFLPQGVWSRVLPTPGGGLILKAGWLMEADKALVSRFDFSSTGQLEDIIISTETRISTSA